QIDVFMDDGFTKEEWKMRAETKKILDENIEVCATCVRVPSFVGHAESVNIEFENPMSVEQAREALSNAPGVVLVDDDTRPFITPVEIAGEDGVYVSRIRKDPTVKNGLALWIVSDNVRKGAALNAIQIAEALINNHGL
ncbi:MAG: aspartate-semialdehyde dehydrogenase, partial [Proteobacteria bacterium]|nr:aspartate-semialdehyde dehydrogenase [Pseudomonadota bacterium]